MVRISSSPDRSPVKSLTEPAVGIDILEFQFPWLAKLFVYRAVIGSPTLDISATHIAQKDIGACPDVYTDYFAVAHSSRIKQALRAAHYNEYKSDTYIQGIENSITGTVTGPGLQTCPYL